MKVKKTWLKGWRRMVSVLLMAALVAGNMPAGTLAQTAGSAAGRKNVASSSNASEADSDDGDIFTPVTPSDSDEGQKRATVSNAKAAAAEEPFEIWFNTDKKTGVSAGWQDEQKLVYSFSDMAPKTNQVSYEGNVYYTVQGTANPKSKDNIPTEGAAMSVKAPAAGTITVYGICGSGKTLYASRAESEDSASAELMETVAGDGKAVSCTVAVEAGNVAYFWCQGSKLQFAGFVFELPKESETIPLRLTGADLGEAKITFSNGVTEDVTVGAGSEEVTLTTGYKYAVSIDSALLTIDMTELDLTGSVPQEIAIQVTAAPMHKVSGEIKGLPADISVVSLSYRDESGTVTPAKLLNGNYEAKLKNGNYTALAELGGGTGGWEVFDHVAVTGTEGEAIANDVWFYGSEPEYPTEYRPELRVGQSGNTDYETIGEAVAAVSAMERGDNDYVTLTLCDDEYFEQVVIDTPNIKLAAAEGVNPEICWYYGIGYKYYSIDESGYYNLKHANDKYEKNFAAKWGAAVTLKSNADGFMAEGIQFINTFNQYVTAEEIADGAEVITSEEYGQGVSSSLQERDSMDMDVSNTANVERAAALVCDADEAEFFECTFLSSQDTLYTGTGKQYYRDCTIIGQTDYIFGNTGTSCIFDNCELQWLGYTGSNSKAGYITASRGRYLFRGCSVTSNKEAGYQVTPGYFGRPWGTASDVKMIGTAITEGTINADGWYQMSGVTPEDVIFREYGNYIINPENRKDQSKFFYSSYAQENKAFRLGRTEAEGLAESAADGQYLGSWVPLHLIETALDLSGVAGWNEAETEKSWKFTYFGPSTSSAINTYSAPDKIAGDIVMNSCTYNGDGTINKKGGKFVSSDPADGLGLYYTTIDPATENFRLQADVTIDYMNPTPDGQEGFALMIRDMIGSAGESGSLESNLVSVTATKLPSDGLNGVNEVKDMVGVRNYTGITNPSTIDSSTLKVYRQGFDADGKKVVVGGKYRVSLEKTSNAYITTQYEILEDGSTGGELGQHILYIPAKDANAEAVNSYEELDDPMLVQDTEKAYLGFAAARGMNVTFGNIEFTTSEWKASEWEQAPVSYVEPNYQITSPDTSAETSYTLVFKANADGSAKIYQGDVLADEQVEITANQEFAKTYSIGGTTAFKVEFTPKPGYKPSSYQELSDYGTKIIEKAVTVRRIGKEDTIYVSQDGISSNNGISYEDSVDLQTAFDFAAAGQTILLKPGEYDMSGKGFTVARGRNGSEENPITVTGDGGYATLDFGRTGNGVTLWGNYWNLSFINITKTRDGVKGVQLSGSHCLLERMNFYNNGNTGLQISGSSEETIAQWPSYNTILNCSSINNADSEMEDADGFAAKLTSGEGNVFDGCIAAYNADDGWDFFAKVATGSIGAATIQNSVAYSNGTIMATPGSGKANWKFADVFCDENGTLTVADTAIRLDAGNGNGFKMGGSNMPGSHVLKNSIAYENKAKGFDSNSCTDIKIYDSTSYNNGSYNVAMYTSDSSATTDYAADGILSFRVGTNVREQLALQGQATTAVYGNSNYYWDTDSRTSHNTASSQTAVKADWFQSLDTSVEPERNSDGSINMHGLLLLSEEGLAASGDDAGARGAVWGQEEVERAVIWVVGDSTVSGFSDSYYLPRQGYGESLSDYLNATVYNLAVSGASSKDFTGMANYRTLVNGNSTVPAMGQVPDQKQYLLIGFGHNDEKTELARYTNPNGDYKTEGSFAHSLYTNYVKPAMDAGVIPIVCTPIVRLTDENTMESYQSASGHITSTTEAGGVTYEGGDYAKAIRGMCGALGIEYIDLTELTKELNVELGEEVQWLHSFTGAKYGTDGSSLTATGLDKTHTNSYGAKMNAWLIAEAQTSLKTFSKNKVRPSYEADFADAVNPDYQVSDYQSPTEPSAIWPVYIDRDEKVWSGSVFGDVGGQGNITGGDFTSAVGEDGVTLGVANNRGKIASTVDGLMMYYIKLPAGTEFTLSATARVNSLAANNQVSFGLMARDDMYVDTYTGAMMGDYVAAASRNHGAVNGFGRKSGALFDGPAADHIYGIGDTLELELAGTADGYTLTYGDNVPVSAGFDYALTAVDSDYIYVGFFVARNCNVTFSNISLQVEDADNPDPDDPNPDNPDPDDPTPDDKTADTSVLTGLIDSTANLLGEEYTQASWETLKSALAYAEIVLGKDKVNQEEVDRASALLQAALAGLVKKPAETQTDSSDEDYNDSSNNSNDGQWNQITLSSGRIVWQCSLKGYNVTNGWAYVRNPYSTSGQSEYGWFCFDENGIMRTGWFKDTDGSLYYLSPISNGSQGLMLTGWQLIDGKYYCFNERNGGPLGSLLINTVTPDGYRVDENGVWNSSR